MVFQDSLSLLQTSVDIFPVVLMPSLHTHDHVHRHTTHSCSQNVQLHELIQLNKIYKNFLKEII
jgi:hypothetical protein